VRFNRKFGRLIHSLWGYVLFFGIIFSGLLSLQGCVKENHFLLKPVKNPSMEWASNQKKLESIQSWKIQGKVGISDGVNAQSIEVIWTQDKANYEMDFYGPLEIKIGSLIKNSEGLFLVTPSARLSAKDPESLMAKEFGWSLPIQGLVDWVRGLPSPEDSGGSHTLNTFGYLARLKSQGWEITYLNYEPMAIQGQNELGPITKVGLPTRMILKQGDIRLVVFIEKWKISN
jgi:outer membrane lipoprotein LolB